MAPSKIRSLVDRLTAARTRFGSAIHTKGLGSAFVSAPGQPLAHPRMLVGRIVVDDGVDYFPCQDLLLDRVEETNELLVAMAPACCGR